MTIEQIGIGAAPGDNTGDGLRTAMTKVNNNFSNSSHAASKLTGTAPENVPLNSDLGTASTKDTGTATGDVLLADSLPQNGGDLFNSTNYQPETSGNGIGVVRLLKNVSGSGADGAILSSSELDLTYVTGAGAMVAVGIPPSTGSWKHVAGFALSSGNFSWYVRVV